ncbi:MULTISPECIES: flagellar basal body rod protein FlgB [unclassified Salipiger]|uniref:flagellar basal body rod protein FlgB n=1 Tax=unclassified Salipiger TaxID=2640570 RepID=UPI00080AB2FA|nr:MULTISPECIES: flagellar basal body rod protein FlgB [unclassified Salipiger]ANT63278.1 flagellar biosynthesis protein FlgB [Salipiger sp. CCB-MM3]NDW00455.1 flagellar basal body rod protein FlgB [Salipiger sp. PrR002]NDW56413.1 flagellar basal body rod protein FlgB [Salipiger sp. PrR004]
MKLGGMSFFQLASDRMTWLGARQTVISENIANADTPNYKAREVNDFAEALEGQRSFNGLDTTDSQHIRNTTTAPDGVRIERDETAWEGSLDGNTVSVEQQTIKAAEVAGNYRLAAELYRKGNSLLTIAVTGIR